MQITRTASMLCKAFAVTWLYSIIWGSAKCYEMNDDDGMRTDLWYYSEEMLQSVPLQPGSFLKAVQCCTASTLC